MIALTQRNEQVALKKSTSAAVAAHLCCACARLYDVLSRVCFASRCYTTAQLKLVVLLPYFFLTTDRFAHFLEHLFK